MNDDLDQELWLNRQRMAGGEDTSCSPGSEEACGLALEEVCTCRCGGKNHGRMKKDQTELFPDERTEADG